MTKWETNRTDAADKYGLSYVSEPFLATSIPNDSSQGDSEANTIQRRFFYACKVHTGTPVHWISTNWLILDLVDTELRKPSLSWYSPLFATKRGPYGKRKQLFPNSTLRLSPSPTFTVRQVFGEPQPVQLCRNWRRRILHGPRATRTAQTLWINGLSFFARGEWRHKCIEPVDYSHSSTPLPSLQGETNRWRGVILRLSRHHILVFLCRMDVL